MVACTTNKSIDNLGLPITVRFSTSNSHFLRLARGNFKKIFGVRVFKHKIIGCFDRRTCSLGGSLATDDERGLQSARKRRFLGVGAG